MKQMYFTPGPTELYPTVADHIKSAIEYHICSISHRSREFIKIFQQTTSAVRALLNVSDNHSLFFMGSATEAMERVLENCVAGKSHHFVNGAFSKRFYEIAAALNKQPEKSEVSFGRGFNFNDIEIADDTELICITQNETSTGVAVNAREIYDLKTKYPEKLIAVDIVSSAPYIDIDFAKIDCAFFSVQKGFGLPAGLGVLIVNDACLEKSELLHSKNRSIGSYHAFSSLKKYALKYQTPETPNVLAIYLLGRVCEDILAYGAEKMRHETDVKADMLYSIIESHTQLAPFVKQRADQSKTVIVAENEMSDVHQILNREGIVIGSGYGKYKEQHIRIANFPQHRVEDVERLMKLMT